MSIPFNGIIYHLIDVYLSMAIFKCSILQSKIDTLFRSKFMENTFSKISGLEALEVMP